jgi:hypothetical protein
MLTCFGMIWNCENFSIQNTKFDKIHAFSKIFIYSKLIVKKNMTYWGSYKYNKFKNSKKNRLKIPKKDNSLKCKVNTLLNVF